MSELIHVIPENVQTNSVIFIETAEHAYIWIRDEVTIVDWCNENYGVDRFEGDTYHAHWLAGRYNGKVIATNVFTVEEANEALVTHRASING